ncbi:MAG TPA: tetratricopeptide repeat protein [Phycisphaerae bacterium]
MDRSVLKNSLFIFLAVFALCLTGCATNLETFRKEGVSQYNQQQFDQSLTTLDKALHQDQFDAVSNTYSGLIYLHQDKLQQAEYHLRLALDADPSSEQAKNGLTLTLIKQGKPDEALDALERAAKLSEKVTDPRWEKTIKRPYTKQVEEGLYLGKANDRIRIAKAYENPPIADYDNAFVYYKKALDISPDDTSIMIAIADLAEKARNPERAREYLRQAYLKNPGTPGLTESMTRNGLAISDVLSPR